VISFGDRTIRTNVSNDILNVYLRPSTKIWAAIDSLMVTQLQSGEYEVFLFQITVSAAHPVAIRPKSLWNVIRAAQTGVFDLDIRISYLVFIDVCIPCAAETGLKCRNVEKRINACLSGPIESFPSQLKNAHLNLVFVVPKQNAENYKIQRYLDNGKAAADISRISPRLTGRSSVRPLNGR
jgi:hypothetical protein